MNDVTFDTLSRRTGVPGPRRGALAAIAGATMTAVMARPTSAAKQGKNARKQTQKQVKKLCGQQESQCRVALAAGCAGNVECLGGLICCESLRTCDVDEFFACLLSST